MVPICIAVAFSCHVPRVDDWGLVIEPYFEWLDGKGLWHFLNSAGNDSRHNAAQLLHAITLKGFAWNPVLESLICVGLGGVAAVVAVDWWRQQERLGPWAVLAGVAGAWFVMSPYQWMNWSWGIQICYMLPIAGTMLMFWVLNQPWSLGKRVGWALLPCWAAVFSFANGWLAVLLGGAVLLWQVCRQDRSAAGVAALGVWLLSAVLAGILYAQGWPESKGVSDSGLFESLMERPGAAMTFYAQVLGAPLADVHLTMQREARVAVQGWLSVVVAGVSAVLLGACLVLLWRRRSRLEDRDWLPWVLLVLWGLGNTAAITLARLGDSGYGPFHSRYPGFTGWFFVGLLGLLAQVEGCCWRWVRGGFLVLMILGAGVGGIQGWMDVQRIARHCDLLESAVALRHVAPEPRYLEATRPSRSFETIGLLDRLESEGLLHVKTILSPKVMDMAVASAGWAQGEMTEAAAVPGGLKVTGWAFDRASRGPVRGVILSYQKPEEEEKWLGMATRYTVMHKKAEKVGARVIEDRMGWVYEPVNEEETVFMRKTSLKLKRNDLPTGTVVIRAYAFDPRNGWVSALEGVQTVVLPESAVAPQKQ